MIRPNFGPEDWLPLLFLPCVPLSQSTHNPSTDLATVYYARGKAKPSNKTQDDIDLAEVVSICDMAPEIVV